MIAAKRISHMDNAMLRAAEGGDCLSQVNVAVLHENLRNVASGSDMTRNSMDVAVHSAQSLHWWGRAAAQGSPKAQAMLAGRLESGDGVPQDLVMALTWYLIAEPRLRGDEIDRTRATRRRLARRMDAAAVRRAEKDAQSWTAQIEAVASPFTLR